MTRPYDHGTTDRLVAIEERAGLRCDKCQGLTRTVVYVSDNGDLKASLEGCRACRSGIYAMPVED